MREATNGPEVVEAIRDRTGVSIEVIRGREEADLIFSNFSIASLDRDRDYVYVDVGGGSTEITLIRSGKRVEAMSFRIGSVRLLKGKVKPEIQEELRTWCQELMVKHEVSNAMVIGTGGNINRLHKLSGGYGPDPISKQALEATLRKLEQASHAERLDRYGLKPDRADVIVPACRIYLDAMDLFAAEQMVVPKVGLGDGMVLDLHRRRNA
jgi:exopolyphosphatase/guanosine-5'-triphosphate,3'-diphosphate pyrophosphatase